MDATYWRKQTADKPLFPDLVWSRPENRQARGKLLIIGGNLHGFAAAAEAYQQAEKAGAGTIRVILPDAIQKVVGGFFENAIFAPSTPSGSFGQPSLATMLEEAAWADGVLLAGDLGRNSETAIVLEKFVTSYSGPLIITKDAVDYFKDTPQLLAKRSQTAIVLSLAQLQKLASSLHFKQAFTFNMDLLQLIDTLHEFSAEFDCHIVVRHLEQLAIASGGQIITYHDGQDQEIWRVGTAAKMAVWYMQNPTKPREAMASALTESF